MAVTFLTDKDKVLTYADQVLTDDEKAKARANIGVDLSNMLTSPDGTKWVLSVSNNGTVTATRYASGDSGDVPTVIETYTIFVPDNATNDYIGTTMNADEFLALFYDPYVINPPAGVSVTKSSIGKDQSGIYDMWEYDFCPDGYERTILLSSGLHPIELAAQFGMANFISSLYNNTEHEGLQYIRNKVRIKLIPIANPWGANQSTRSYGNVNGVNMNRNFDSDGRWGMFTSNGDIYNKKGDTPFSEAETKNLAAWVVANNIEGEFWMDCHTSEGSSQYDNWVDYMTESAIADRIKAALTKLEDWFLQTYGSASRTNEVKTSLSATTGMGMRGGWVQWFGGIPGFTLEQAPGNTIFGTSQSNDAGDINNYSMNISTYVQEILLEKYRNSVTAIPVTSIAFADISASSDDVSESIALTVNPSDTTQNRFTWVSSNTDVCEVYGGTEKAVLVYKGAGQTTITVTSKYDSTITTSFTVTVEGESERVTEIGAKVSSISSGTGLPYPNSTRILTDLIPVSAGSFTFTNDNGMTMKAWHYDQNGWATGITIGDMTATSISGTIPSDGYVRVIFAASGNPEMTDTTIVAISGEINGDDYALVVSTVAEQTVRNIGARLGTYKSADFSIITSTNRILSDAFHFCIYNTYTLTLPTGYIGNTIPCDDDGNLTGGMEDTFYQTFTINTGCKRLYIRRSDGADIAEEEIYNILISTSIHDTIKYQLVASTEA